MKKVIFISNFLSFHQSDLWDDFCKNDVDFTFLATEENVVTEKRIDKRPYVKFSYLFSDDSLANFLRFADVIIIGDCCDRRIFRMLPDDKVYFLASEHIFRNYLNPRNVLASIRRMGKIKRCFRYKNTYCLAYSSFIGKEFNFFGIARNKVYKFGYFPETNQQEDCLIGKDPYSILVAGRLLRLKRNFFAIKALQFLQKTDRRFHLTVVGDGKDKKHLVNLVRRCGLDDQVAFLPPIPHEQLIELMKRTQIFIFASNHQEGWGAVVNEAMSCGCVVFASRKAGSTNYLVEDSINGYAFSSLADFKKKISIYSNSDVEKIGKIQQAAFATINNYWNYRCASDRLYDFVVSGSQSLYFPSGPLSKG